MRIRYGKPIKVKSLLGNQFSSLTGDAFSTATTVIMFQNQHYYYSWNWNSFKYNFTLPSHKYFFYAKFKNNLTIRHTIVIGTQNDGSISTYDYYNPSSIVISNERYTIFDNTNSAISRLDNIWFYYNSSYSSEKFNSDIDIPEYWILVDLTDIFGNRKEPTREEFYNKYSRYFSLIAAGGEITVDDKAGQIKTIKSTFDDYTEVEYLESTSTQYIDTKYIPNQNTKIIFDTKMNQISGQGVYPRQGRHGEGQRLSIYLTPSVTEFAMGDYKQLGINAWNQRHTYELDVPNLCAKLDGEVVATFEPLSWSNQESLYLFARHVSTSPYYDGNGNITNYNIKIYESNILVHNFIPCIHNNDNTPGMYDLVDGIFYTNQGTGTFIAGPAKSLPSDYQEVEYIESTGTQYIDTDISISSTDASFMSKLKFSVSSFADGDQVILGNTYQDNCMYWLPQFGGTTLRMFSRGNGSGNIVYGPNLITNTIYNINSYTSQTLQKLVVNDNVYSKTNNLTMMDSQNLYLFSNNYKNTTVTAYSAIKLYKAQLYKSEQLVRDFIPCYRKSDNVIGMYDLIGKQFYTNAGTGTFLKGPNVATVISCKVAGGSSDIYYGYNQLAKPPETSGTKWIGYNCTMTAENGVATCVANGGKYPALASEFYKTIYELGHIYMHLAKFKQDTAVTSGTFAINTNGMSTKLSGNSTTVVGEWVDLYFFGRGQGASTYSNTFNIQGGENAVSGATFYVKDCICIDLTDWFGQGKEPSTVEEFKEKFTKEYYGFCPTPIKLTRYQIEALPNYGYNQLGPLWATDTSNGVTATIKNDGKDIELSGTATGWYTKDKNLGQTIPSGHKVLVMSEMINPTGANFGYRLRYNSNNPIYANKEFNKIHTLTDNVNKFQVYADLGDNCTGIKLNNLVIIDLTDWYGPGNEPTTIEEFKATFPNKYYPYSKKRLLNKYMINKLEN